MAKTSSVTSLHYRGDCVALFCFDPQNVQSKIIEAISTAELCEQQVRQDVFRSRSNSLDAKKPLERRAAFCWTQKREFAPGI
ncbi:hypothetical protein [Agrobacterium rubi]|uniref:Uncharacterized protein n=1 Tax=Agrobacterium rubi TaxID=28099 RepID=A0AAE7QZY3_9HYPH|nr:hypothetical protein [Agrobacterium rubi]NTE87123.1 hypothetical protein [Agrobacterium rubi]NTF03057.1 hypothetical protein [Agrobacterium rubi]NTF37301.1 hypothetical protein [Agrobacterium rubi]QTF99719.1 hypothetical protein G6M88_04575 [Agrobacterium rubi]